jgi:hypothetical protein
VFLVVLVRDVALNVIQMERTSKEELLEVIEQQMSSSILGGMEQEYEELEDLGYIKINRDAAQHSASLTSLGEEHLEDLRRSH